MASIFRKTVARMRAKSSNGFIQGAPSSIFRPSGWGRDGRRERAVDLGHDYESYYKNLYTKNGIVFACSQTIAKPFSEIRFITQEVKAGRPGDLVDNRGLSLLENPWPSATSAQMNVQAVQDFVLAGNVYAVLEKADGRNKDPKPRIRLLRPDWVVICLNKAAEEAVKSDIIGYRYFPGGVNRRNSPKSVFYTVDEVAHWSYTPDPAARYRGMSPLSPVIDEILADSAAVKHKKRFFSNAATPSMTVSLHETITPAQFKDAEEQILASISKDPYEPMIFGGGADVKIVGADLRSVDFRNVMGSGETRIAAALGTHPVLVGLSEGMQGSSLNAGNARVAKDIFIDMTLRPLFASWCDALSKLVDVPDGHRLWYDDRDVAFLRADRKELTEIISKETEVYTRLIREGVTADSAKEFLINRGDWSVIEHTGLVSVQLWPPGSEITPPGSGPTTAPQGAGPAGTGDAAVRRPPTPKPRSQVGKAHMDLLEFDPAVSYKAIEDAMAFYKGPEGEDLWTTSPPRP